MARKLQTFKRLSGNRFFVQFLRCKSFIFNTRILKSHIVRQSPRGSILILVLWVIGLLSLFAGQIGLTVGQRIKVVAKIEQNNRLRFLARAGIKKGIAALRSDLRKNNGIYTPFGKSYRHNNEDLFMSTQLGNGFFEVSYQVFDMSAQREVKRYGITDEESRLNINLAHRTEMTRLLQRAAGVDDNQILKIVDGILGWREEGSANIEGFYSDDYYYNLEYFYSAKNERLEVLEELLLVYGMTPRVYKNILPYITIYGDGLININTASGYVLYSLGFEDDLIQKIIAVRSGIDGEQGTIDDYIFQRPFDIAIEMRAFIQMEEGDRGVIDQINRRGRLKTNSSFYRIESTASVPNRNGELYAYGIYNSRDNWLEYYFEK